MKLLVSSTAVQFILITKYTVVYELLVPDLRSTCIKILPGVVLTLCWLIYFQLDSKTPEEDKQSKALAILKLFCNNPGIQAHLKPLLAAK